MIIAIDGPAASGKSTTAKLLAKRFNLLFLDTGAMYRAVAYFIVQIASKSDGLDNTIQSLLNHDEAALRHLEDIQIEFEDEKIILNGIDVSTEIRTAEITKISSVIATIKEVRHKMVSEQRRLSENQDVILDGRDIGTVVFPNADFKFFLTASLEVRAKRRYDEMVNKGINISLDDIKKDLSWRDNNDTERLEAPLKKADDAIEIDTTEMTIEEQVKIITELINIVDS